MIKDQEWVLWYFFTDPRQRLPAWKIIPQSVVRYPDFSTVLFTILWVSTAIIRLAIYPVPDRSVSTIIIFEKIISSETTKDEKIFITSKITDDKISFLAWLIHWIYGSTNSVAVKNKLQQNAKQNLVKKNKLLCVFCLFVCFSLSGDDGSVGWCLLYVVLFLLFIFNCVVNTFDLHK